MRAVGSAARISATRAASREMSMMTTSADGSRSNGTSGIEEPMRDRSMRAVVVAATITFSDAEPWFGQRELGPALAGLLRELVHESDRVGVVVARSGLDRAVGEHALHQVAPGVGSHDRESPVVVLADAAGRDVGVLRGKIGTELAAFASPLVALLERHLVVVAVVHPDLEHALDVHLLDVGLVQPVLGLEELLEDRVVEGLRTQEPDAQREAPGDLAGLSLLHHGRYRRLTRHADERDPLVVLVEVVVRERVRGIRVAASRRRHDVGARARDAWDRLPR